MLRDYLSSRSEPRVELDRRAREGRLRDERLERLVLRLPRRRERLGRLRRGLRLLAAAVNGGGAGGPIGTPQHGSTGGMTAPAAPLCPQPACWA